MNNESFIKAYNESRNGASQFFRHPLARRFIYSDGVKECAEAGCYWLLDILGTELPGAFKKREESHLCIVAVKVTNQSAEITGEFCEDDTDTYKKRITHTDLPEGEWLFYVSQEDDGSLMCILPTEY